MFYRYKTHKKIWGACRNFYDRRNFYEIHKIIDFYPKIDKKWAKKLSQNRFFDLFPSENVRTLLGPGKDLDYGSFPPLTLGVTLGKFGIKTIFYDFWLHRTRTCVCGDLQKAKKWPQKSFFGLFPSENVKILLRPGKDLNSGSFPPLILGVTLGKFWIKSIFDVFLCITGFWVKKGPKSMKLRRIFWVRRIFYGYQKNFWAST